MPTENLQICWSDEQAVSGSVLELMSCCCKKERIPERCGCASNALTCTDTYQCKNCGNDASDNDSLE